MILIILHITQRRNWQLATQMGYYRSDSLDSEGFIHCSLPSQVADVANDFYHGQSGLILLAIAEELLEAEVRYEDCYATGQQFPHIYGELNLDAVVKILEFIPQQDGRFTCPELNLTEK